MAALVSFMRGVGAPGTTAAECRVVSADFMVDVFAVRLVLGLKLSQVRDRVGVRDRVQDATGHLLVPSSGSDQSVHARSQQHGHQSGLV